MPRPVVPRRPAPALAAVLVLGTALLAGCGSSPQKAVDADHLSQQIATGLAQRYQVAAPAVTCPSGEANTAGTSFSCDATISGQHLPVNAQVHAPDDVRWQPAASVVSTTETASALDQRFGAALGGSIQAQCGTAPVKVVAVNASFTCHATVGTEDRTFRVTATDLVGDVSLSLLPPTTGPGSTTPAVTAPPTPGSTPSNTLPGD